MYSWVSGNFRNMQLATGRAGLLLAALLVLAGAACCAGLAGFIAAFARCYADGPSNSNVFTAVWICGVAVLMAVQAACVITKPSCTIKGRPGARFHAWVWYAAWMFSCGIILLVSLAIALPPQSGWAVLWIFLSAIILLATVQQKQLATAQSSSTGPTSPAAYRSDVEADIVVTESQLGSLGTKETAADPQAQQADSASTAQHAHVSAGKCCTCSKACWRRCCSGCGSCMGWSSLFWAAILGVFLVIQAANLASDLRSYPPPGVLVEVPITLADGGKTNVKLHIDCSGPSTPGLSTFILEAGGGAPGVSMAGIADGLAAASRRVCWYDRLGYGWSDDAFKPTTTGRSTEALHHLLSAAPAGTAPAPYIVVGHSAGGQLMMQYAASYPNQVTGLALLDSYSDVAIYLYMMRGAGRTMKSHQVQAANGTSLSLPDVSANYVATVPIVDLLRAVTPLAWARWITSGGKSGKYGAVSAALYGNNKEWQAQWVEVLGLASGNTLADNLTLSGQGMVWQGAGWPNFSPKPVLLLPAEETLRLPSVCKAGADYTTSAECVSSLRQPQGFCEALHGKSGGGLNKCLAEAVYPDLYAAYKDTLSSNSTLFVVPGSHGFVTDMPQLAVEQLLAKFAGV